MHVIGNPWFARMAKRHVTTLPGAAVAPAKSCRKAQSGSRDTPRVRGGEQWEIVPFLGEQERGTAEPSRDPTAPAAPQRTPPQAKPKPGLEGETGLTPLAAARVRFSGNRAEPRAVQRLCSGQLTHFCSCSFVGSNAVPNKVATLINYRT